MREGPSHGYDYYPQNIAGNIPLPTFVVEHEWRSHYYDCNPYHRVTNNRPSTFGPQATAHDMEEEEF
jgi:hypothetical protein